MTSQSKVKLKVLGLSYSQTQSGAYALVLAEERGTRRIPIIVGGFEAQAIAIELEKLTPPRPLTHDLFVNFAKSFNTPEGKAAIRNNIAYYRGTAQILLKGWRDLGYYVYGGENAPYIWCRVPDSYTSWSFFDYLLNTCQVVCTPGVGFGPSGEGYVRFSAFSHRKDCEEALKRMKAL